MLIGKFAKRVNATIDTIRYYMEVELLKPQKSKNRYNFTEKECEDFMNIRELRNLGLSIRAIKEIQYNREVLGCSSREQWSRNQKIVEKELFSINTEIEELTNRKQKLSELHKKLVTNLKSAD